MAYFYRVAAALGGKALDLVLELPAAPNNTIT